ncbi:tRNA (5-methylaminomethyl-2-thiouridine)(34)-methyltransferase MnmD [Maribacter sp. 2307ULW6-5]|uniref:tRNA (5-methylaminomethyl-2-thiouridine)(34)-methyltransferase MnmD n=1 Tax=Maribacter sp. 2307ULW6-5 TaxID=3386275 RepID=UPI0039BCC968
MEREVIVTADGSKTIQIKDWNEQYHSKHGAFQEAYHVFIAHGLRRFKARSINIMEVGFGTGLNALITLLEAPRLDLRVTYTGVEAYPVSLQEVSQLNHVERLEAQEWKEAYDLMHQGAWQVPLDIAPHFVLEKQQRLFKDIDAVGLFDLIYFDAFGARVQPELWTVPIFQKMAAALIPGGILVTYSAKGSVRRAMEAVGLLVERLPGPPGKREMLRATKPLG